jgi:hypothetical protein
MSFYCLPSSSSIWPSAREAHDYEGGFQIIEDLLGKLSDSSNPLPSALTWPWPIGPALPLGETLCRTSEDRGSTGTVRSLPEKPCSVIIDKIVEKRKSDPRSIPKGHTLESLPARQRRVQQLPKAEGRALMPFDFRRSSEVTFNDCR